MQSLHLELKSTPARLSIQHQDARMQISRTRGNFEIEHGDNSVSIETTQPSISVDSTACRESYGYYTALAFMYELTAYSLRQAGRGISDTVGSGDSLADGASGGASVANQAFDRQFLDEQDRQFVIAFAPKVPPSIRITPGEVRIKAAYTAPKIQIRPSEPIFSVEPAQISMSAEPSSLQMQAVPGGYSALM